MMPFALIFLNHTPFFNTAVAIISVATECQPISTKGETFPFQVFLYTISEPRHPQIGIQIRLHL